MKQAVTFFSVAVLVLAAGTSRAEEKKPPRDDKDFLIRAVEGSLAEVKLSELAESRASSDKVKEFARHMVKDHKDLNNRLSDYSKNLKIAVLGGLDKEKNAVSERLSKLKGEEFDRAYMKQMVENHEKAVRLFEAQAKSTGDSDLKTLADKALPTLREHLKEARSVLASLK